MAGLPRLGVSLGFIVQTSLVIDVFAGAFHGLARRHFPVLSLPRYQPSCPPRLKCFDHLFNPLVTIHFGSHQLPKPQCQCRIDLQAPSVQWEINGTYHASKSET